MRNPTNPTIPNRSPRAPERKPARLGLPGGEQHFSDPAHRLARHYA